MQIVRDGQPDSSPSPADPAHRGVDPARGVGPGARRGAVLAVLSDLATIGAVLSATLFGGRLWPGTTDLRSLAVPAIIALGLIGTLRHRGRDRPFKSMTRAIRQIVAVGAYGSSICLLMLLTPDPLSSAHWLPVACALAPPAIFALRAVVVPKRRRAGTWRQRSLIIGTPAGFQRVRATFEADPGPGYDIVGTLGFRAFLDHVEELGPAGPADGAPASRLRALLDDFGADILLLALHGCAAELQQAALAAVSGDTVPFAVIPDFDGLPVVGWSRRPFLTQSLVMITFRNSLDHPFRRLTKTLFDVAAAALSVVLLAPVLLLVAVLVKLDGGPVLFGHPRLGRNGRVFRCLKFRTMVVDAEQALERRLAGDQAAAAEWDLKRKLRHDPRITPVGRLLRITSVDELPQLFNVLRGDMSLVGPRPIVAAEAVRYGRNIDFYYRTRPGMTGLWQVSGRSETSYDRRVEMDVWYVKNWSLLHDVKILLRTMPAVLKRCGAL